jgi:hypothetical protein
LKGNVHGNLKLLMVLKTITIKYGTVLNIHDLAALVKIWESYEMAL